MICRHIYAAYARDWIETPARWQTNSLSLRELPGGSIIIWENKYSELNGIHLDQLSADSAWREQATFNDGAVRIFEKSNQP